MASGEVYLEKGKIGSQGRSRHLTSSPINSDMSALSDSDFTNLSSSANSTIKSDLSSGGTKYARKSHREAIATLDFFLDDVNQTTEKVKLEEEQKLLIKSANNELQKSSDDQPQQLANTEPKFNFKLSNTSEVFLKKSSSMPSVVSEEEMSNFDSRLQKSFDDIRSIEYDVFSDDEADTHEKKKEIHARKKSERTDVSMSSQSSDVLTNHSNGITQLNHLCNFLEQYDQQRKKENSELTKRVRNSEDGHWKRASIATDVPIEKKPENLSPPQRHSMVFAVPKEKPKKSKATKLKGNNAAKDKIKKTKYLVSLPFVLAAKSVDSIKFGSSQNLDKIGKTKPKKTQNYSADDMEIGKVSHVSDEWRNLSVKSSSKNTKQSFADFLNDSVTGRHDVDTTKIKETKVDTPVSPVVAVTADAPPQSLNEESKLKENEPSTSDINKKVFPLKPPSPQRAKSEERNYKNTKKMTEWGSLQNAFPVEENQLETSLDLLNHLEQMITSNRPHHAKKNSHHGVKRLSRGKKSKQVNSNMYLPQTDIPGFTSKFLAAHAMTNQLTLTLSMGDIEALSTPGSEENVQPAVVSSQEVSI